MSKDNVIDNNENTDEVVDKNNDENQYENESLDNENQEETFDIEEIEKIKVQLDDKTKKCEEYFTMLQRAAAEFDNYKKRTIKEKEGIYSDAVCDVVSAFLPVVDNLERAIKASNENDDEKSLKEGVELVFKQIIEVMKNLKVEEIQSTGGEFDPQLHNAVMHVGDDACGENTVVEEFQKGYKYKDKVIRHSMVKVAN